MIRRPLPVRRHPFHKRTGTAAPKKRGGPIGVFMIKLLIVDDEITTIRRIQSRIDFPSAGIGEVRTAADGGDALEACTDWTPDILLSDIMMPGMNGLELAEKLRAKRPDLQIIFLSGYMEKEYLKGAIRLQVIDYIEKPIDMKGLFDTLKVAVGRILDARKSAERLDGRRDGAEEGQPAGRNEEEERRRAENLEKECALMLAGREEPDSLLEERIAGLALGENGTQSFALELAFYRAEEKEYDALSDILPLVGRVAAEQNLRTIAAVREEDIAVFVFAGAEKKISDKVFFVSEYLRALRKELVILGRHYTAGTGHVCTDWHELRESFREAEEATRLAFFMGPGSHSYYRKSAQKYNFKTSGGREIIRGMRKNSRDSTVFQLKAQYEEIRRCEGTDIDDIRRFYSSMVLEAVKLGREEGAELYPEYAGEYDLLLVVMSQSFLVELLDFLLMGVEAWYNFLEKEFYPNATVNWLIRYIRENYSDPDLDMVALGKASNLSTTYINHLFKNTTGKTVKSYITDYRMQQAVRLLRNPTVPVGDIAVRCGYRNGNYFSFRFKEHFGISPTEYREQSGEPEKKEQ